MADDLIASARSMTSVADGQYLAVGMPKAALTPATLTAMVGLYNGGALKVPDNVANIVSGVQTHALDTITSANIPELNEAMTAAGISGASTLTGTNLSTAIASVTANANISPSVKSAVSTLTASGSPLANAISAADGLSTLTSKLLPPGNPAAFGSFIQKVQSHLADSAEVKKAVNFINTQDFSNYGGGVKDMASMTDRGLTNSLGSLPSASAVMSATGSMFNGIQPSKMGSLSGFVENLRNNKLGNATNVNQKLTAAGVDVNDIHNPAYADKIKNVLGGIKDPAAINASANQFGITNPFAGLPSYNGDDSSLYNSNPLAGGAPSTSAVPTGAVTIGSSGVSTAFGADIAPSTNLPEGAGGIKSLRDLGDPSKLAMPSDVSAVTGGLPAVGAKFSDLGATDFTPGKAATALGGVKMPDLPKLNSFASGLAPAAGSLIDGAKGQLSGLMGNLSSTIKNMTGVGGGPHGLPALRDIMGPITGQHPAMQLAMLDPTSPDAHAAISSAVSASNNFFATAGIDLNAPPPNGLKSCMNFATSLHKMGADPDTSDMLGVMATDDEHGEAIKASCAEGQNNAALADIGVAPPVNDASTTYTKDRAVLDKKIMQTYHDFLDISGDSGANWLKKAKVLDVRIALRQQQMALDEQFANDQSLVDSQQELIDQSSQLRDAIRAKFA